MPLAHPGDQAQDPAVVGAPVHLGDDQLAVQPAQQRAGVGVRGEGGAYRSPQHLVGGGGVLAGEPVDGHVRVGAAAQGVDDGVGVPGQQQP